MVEENASPPSGGGSQVVVKKSKLSMVWVVPLVVVLLAATIVVQTVRNAGVPIVLTFESADGLEAEKTKIRYKDVEIGIVDAIRVSDDTSHVILDVTIDKSAARHLTEKTRFWVVRPRVTLQGISGLGTLLSGAYINIDPGGEGPPRKEFQGLEAPPVLELGSTAREYVLHAGELGSISVGSPIRYRGFDVGEVISYGMMDDDAGVEIRFFVRSPHQELVCEGANFWDISGLDVVGGASGLNIKVASVEALMIGGIAFENPMGTTERVPAMAGTVFRLHKRHSDIGSFARAKRKLRFFFEGTLRGLNIGAPVEFRGMQIGEVVDISLEYDPETYEIRLPVTAAVEPERFKALSAMAGGSDQAQKERLVGFIEQGMRAQLKSGNIVTGALFVDLVMRPDTEVRLVTGSDAEIVEIPTIPAAIEQITHRVIDVLAKLDAFMDKVDRVEIDRLVNSAAGAAEGIQAFVEADDLAASVTEVKRLLEAAQPIVADIGTLVEGADSGLGEARGAIDQIVARAEVTLGNLNSMLASESPTQADLRAVLKEIATAARSLRSLTTYLERHPEALLKGKPGGN